MFRFLYLHGTHIKICWLLLLNIYGERHQKIGAASVLSSLLVPGGRASILVISAFLYLEFILLVLLCFFLDLSDTLICALN